MVLAVCVTQVNIEEHLEEGELWAIAVLAVMLLIMVIAVIVLWCQPKTKETRLMFKVPLLPLVPCISIFINFYLMVMLDVHTWMRFIVWLVIGMMIYLCYGVPNSVEGQKTKLAKEQQESSSNPPQEPTGS
uniref:Cationic amino acid transporter C-terminal domain-containing protein n=2 Tax=Graphocephala atropunctata TaxID=36148 RepID=A0A1B6L2A0_9HEMI